MVKFPAMTPDDSQNNPRNNPLHALQQTSLQKHESNGLPNGSSGSQNGAPRLCPPFATVALDCGQSSFDRELSYAVPEQWRSILRVGFAVLVPCNRQMVTGFVTGFAQQPNFDGQILPLTRLLSKAPLFERNALKLARWMSAYYHCPLNVCLDCFVPHGWQVAMERRFVLVSQDHHENLRLLRDLSRSPRQAQIVQLLIETARPLTQKEIEKALAGAKLGDGLKRLVEQGALKTVDEVLDSGLKPRRVLAVRALPDKAPDVETWATLEKAAPKQAAALRRLLEWNKPRAAAILARDEEMDSALLRALEKKGFVEFSQLEIRRDPTENLPTADVQRVQLTTEQKNAVAAIENLLTADGRRQEAINNASDARHPPSASCLLLHGVTASGKTEVYLTAIEKCLQLGRRALVLVPEIALTAQTVEIFQRRFQERVAILHSALGAGERFDEWRRARSGKADIIVGARSAIFAPCRNLGLIIIDEEHDHSYKQDSTPRYHARDLALKRAAFDNAVVVLGSATPSLESYHRATRGEFGHVKMTQRIGHRVMPEVETVDMTGEANMGLLPPLSRRLKEELCEVVARGEQAILFLNRRGFATYVQCLECGHAERCENCDVTLTFHRGEGILRCHHCDFQRAVRQECPQCKGWMIGFTGTGTEKIEAEVEDLFKRRQLNTKILRLDRDTTMQKGAHARILTEFRHGRAQVLIGTQMVTKGLDFPNVTLVGVISADAALNVPDFRASERTFQLLAQVSGRAGRGDRPGRVLVQTLTTDHYAIEAACKHDYDLFVGQEIESRQSPCYPPFTHIVNVISSDEDMNMARTRLEKLAIKFHEAIAKEGGGTELLGPVDCPLARVKNKFRFHLMLRDRNRPRLHRVLAVYDNLPTEARSGLIIDVDAMTTL
jgi:primosomal protein N' (replication factor Y)